MGLYMAKCGSMDSGEESPDSVYHEKQMKELCALHALNNLFQDKHAFSKKDLDEICTKLSPNTFINPHRSILGLGNYDVNVLMAAVQKKGYETIWFDKRKSVDCLEMKNIMGFILNTPTDYKWGFVRIPFHRKHWIALRKIDDRYMNLDSKLEAPEVIGSEKDLRRFLCSQLGDGDKELLLVVEQGVAESGTWRKESHLSPTHCIPPPTPQPAPFEGRPGPSATSMPSSSACPLEPLHSTAGNSTK